MTNLQRYLLLVIATGFVAVPIFAAVSAVDTTHPSTAVPSSAAQDNGIHKIKHVIIIMQENRSFDHYFGTFPGADGIPMKDGMPTVCNNDPDRHRCVQPRHDRHDINWGGPHSDVDAEHDIDGGKMDGFIASAERRRLHLCEKKNQPDCVQKGSTEDVMGWHDAREIPNYWTYAGKFVLQDHMFESVNSWSQPAHLYMVSAWSASCSDPHNPMTCRDYIGTQKRSPGNTWSRIDEPDDEEVYAWTDITYLLSKNHVSWAYYLSEGMQPDCEHGEMACAPKPQNLKVPSIWNPLPNFTTVHDDRQLDNIRPLNDYFAAAKTGTLPAVSWVVPEDSTSEHPPNSVHAGQAYVTRVINAAMQSVDWESTAIFLAWDDWGGFYDHEPPPKEDGNGYGMRVPGLVISPYAKQGFIDHQVLSFDAYLKFIEDDFLSGQRIDPKTDGRPDPRPTVREDVNILGDLRADFDFNQKPRAPLILNPDPPPGPASVPGT